jgi:transcriptional regulator with XRE-family HTH domain
MINNSEFAARLTTIMNYYQLSASAFADKIQVPRSSISHLLSGRNKPSLDFVLKVVKEFEDVELYWLLNGKGAFPTASAPTPVKDSIQTAAADIETQSEIIENNRTADPSKNKLEKIVFFYTDGTFKEYIA